jgi:hypothetical protein
LVHFLYFSLFYLSPLLMGILTGLKNIHSCRGSTSTIFTFLISFFYPPFLIVFFHIWNIDLIHIQEILWNAGYTMRRSYSRQFFNLKSKDNRWQENEKTNSEKKLIQSDKTWVWAPLFRMLCNNIIHYTYFTCLCVFECCIIQKDRLRQHISTLVLTICHILKTKIVTEIQYRKQTIKLIKISNNKYFNFQWSQMM